MTLSAMRYSLRHAWALGQRCRTCGYDRPEALERTRQGILCRACRLRHQGRAPLERHHALGRGVPITAPLHANSHAQITALEASYGGRWWAVLVLAWSRLVHTLLDALRRGWHGRAQRGLFYTRFKALYRRSQAFYRSFAYAQDDIVLPRTLPFYCQEIGI